MTYGEAEQLVKAIEEFFDAKHNARQPGADSTEWLNVKFRRDALQEVLVRLVVRA